MPVEAPEGTAALAWMPFSRVVRVSIVGFPRESSISKAEMF